MLPRTRGLSRRPFLPEGRSFARDPSSMSIWAARVHNSPTRTSTSLLRLVVFFPIFLSMRCDILWFQCKIDYFVMLSIMQFCSSHISLGRSGLIMENMTARAVVGGSLPPLFVQPNDHFHIAFSIHASASAAGSASPRYIHHVSGSPTRRTSERRNRLIGKR